MEKDHDSFKRFMRGVHNDTTKQSYAYKMKKFMKYCHENKHVSDQENFEDLLQYDADKTTDILIEYVFHQRDKGDKESTISTANVGPLNFFEMNRRNFYKKEIQRTSPKKRKHGNGKGKPATDEDVFKMVNYTFDLRNQAIIHFLGSTGIRPSALVDPVLRIKHLVSLPDISDLFENWSDNPRFDLKTFPKFQRHCYGVKVYDNDEDENDEGYWAFLTPEASDSLDKYLDSRRINNEELGAESPVFATYGRRKNQIYEYITDDNLHSILKYIVKGSRIPRKKISKHTYDKALVYMFRKRFTVIGSDPHRFDGDGDGIGCESG